MRFNLLCFLILFYSVNLAQSVGIIRGTVTDSTNGEALAFGNVLVKELNVGTSTDSRGYFMITSVPSNFDYTVVVSYVGYQSEEINVKVLPGKITHIDVTLRPSSLELQTVEKIGEKVIEENATDIGLQRITVRELERLPRGVETDIFRTLQYIPGVRSTGDVSARYYVRGGSSNQNLVLIEGVPIYNPFHALGMFSAIDPEVVSSMEFYKGGFTSEFGGRLSSVLSLITKDGNKNRISGKASLSQLTAKASIEGPIPHGSFILTGRKSTSTEVLKKFLNDQNIPIDFYDFSFKLNYSNPNFAPTSKFTVFGFLSNDKLDNDDIRKEDFEWSSNLLGVKWFQAPKETPLFFEVGLSYSNFQGSVDPNFSNAKEKNNELDDFTMNLRVNYISYNKDEIEVGLKINEIDTKLFLENTFGAISDIGGKGTNISLFGKYKFLQIPNFGIDVGTRLNLIHFSKSADGSHFFEPRVSMTYRLFPGVALKSAWGIYIQELTTLSDETEIISLFEPWLITPNYLKPARSTHYMYGIETNFFDNLTIKAEGYYKIAKDVPIVNDNKFFDGDPDLIAGEQESYGWEFFLQYSLGRMNFTSSYSLSHAFKEVEGWLYYPRYDSRHAVNLGLEVNLGDGWQTSAVWVYSSGLPFTESIGFYDRFYFNDITNQNLIENFNPFAILRDINLGRLPDYHRLDLSLSKKIEFSFAKVSLDFSIINVYDRENIFYFTRDTGERVNMLPFLPTASVKVEL